MGNCSGAPHNNTLQVTFDPLPTFAVAKAVIASNAPERGRYRAIVRIGNLQLAVVFLLLSGCCALGPCDGVFSVSGFISEALPQPCLLDVSPKGASRSEFSREVSGSFKESFIISPSTEGHYVNVVCDGRTIKSRLVHYGRDVEIGGDVSLGEITP